MRNPSARTRFRGTERERLEVLGASGTRGTTTGRVARAWTPKEQIEVGRRCHRSDHNMWGGADPCERATGAAPTPGERGPSRAEDGARGLVSRILYRAGSPLGGPAGGSHFSGTGVAAGLERPTREAEGADPRRGSLPYLAFLRVGFTEPPPSPEALVRSYRTVSPLPPGTLARPGVGGLLSAALSLASRPVAVSNHPDPWSPDFPPRGRPKTPRSDCPGLSHRRHRTARLRGAGVLKALEDQSHEGGAPSHNPGAPGPRHRVCSGSLPHSSLEFDEPRRRLLPDQPRTA